MPSVRSIVVDALTEIGVLEPGESLSPALGAIGLLRVRKMLDAMKAKRLALAIQQRTPFTLVSGTSTVTLGPTGTVVMERPTWIDTVNYVNPGATPDQEVQIGIMDRDTYASLTIKQLQSALPTQCFYQTSVTTENGSLFFWPQVTQDVDIVLYHQQGTAVPVSLNTVIVPPNGSEEWFLYGLALRLCSPTGTQVPAQLPMLAAAAWRTLTAPNVIPGTLSVDPAVTVGRAGGYNIYSDTNVVSR